MILTGLLEAQATTPITTADLLFKEATIRGFWLAKWFTRQPPERLGQAIGEVMRLLMTEVMRPAVEAEYNLKDFREALPHTEQTARRGEVLLTS